MKFKSQANMVIEEIRRILDNLDRATQVKLGQSKTGLTASSNIMDPDVSKIWAKGTGYGVGSYSCSSTSFWKGNPEEEKVISLLKSLTGFLKPLVEDDFPPEVDVLLKNSCLIPVVSAYLRNTSILDIATHVPQYRVIHELLQTIAVVPNLWFLLVDAKGHSTIVKLLVQLKRTVDDYSRLLEASSAKDLDMAQLIHDIEAAAAQVEEAVKGLRKGKTLARPSKDAPMKTLEGIYVEEMKRLQFAFMEMIGDGQVFQIPYHYECEAWSSWLETGQEMTCSSRAKRLAQELVTLSTSLPLSHSSSIFMRCDSNRLDVVKVLITGPAGTPYCNGCFEFDIHFPLSYPHSPPMVHFQTTGGNKMRFNPNLFEDGRVCLSILGTWEGSPDELWNREKSSLLQVLVAIQGMIFVEAPYWNDPFVQPFCETEWGERESEEYNSRIRLYTLKYAIVEQIRNPSICFREVILRHFWMRKDEILAQCHEWTENSQEMDLMTRELLEKTVKDLKKTLSTMTAPAPLDGTPQSFQADGITPQVIQADGITPQVIQADGITPQVIQADGITPQVIQADGITPQVIQADGSPPPLDGEKESLCTPRRKRRVGGKPVKGRPLKLHEHDVHPELLKSDPEAELDPGHKHTTGCEDEEKSASPPEGSKKADIGRCSIQ